MNEDDKINNNKGRNKLNFYTPGFIGGVIIGAFILILIYSQLSPKDFNNTPSMFFVIYFIFFGLCGALGGEDIIKGIINFLRLFT